MNKEARARVERVRHAVWRPGVSAADIAEALGSVLVNVLCNTAASAAEADAAIDELAKEIKLRVGFYFEETGRGRLQ